MHLGGYARLSLSPMTLYKLNPKATKPDGRRSIMQHASLEAKRDALFQRMARLHPKLASHQGYKSAHALLNTKYRQAKRGARLGVLQAAHFLICVLEMMPPG
jgi:hypothetical protein